MESILEGILVVGGLSLVFGFWILYLTSKEARAPRPTPEQQAEALARRAEVKSRGGLIR